MKKRPREQLHNIAILDEFMSQQAAPTAGYGFESSAFFSAIVGGLIIVLVIVLKLFKSTTPVEQEENRPRVPAPRRAPNPPVAGRRGAVRRPVRPANDSSEEESDGTGDEEAAEGEDMLDTKKIGKKKREKLEAKAERRSMREQELRDREERRLNEQKREDERKKREAEHATEEAAQLEEERKRKAEEERIEHEAYLKLKEQFTVDEEGVDEHATEQESESLLHEFVNFIKSSKMVMIEDLAAQFRLKTQEAISRIEQLQEMGLLQGVMDDRGKYIYVSEEELHALAKFIRQRGRISVAELAQSSNSIIRLTGQDSDVAR